MSHLFVETLMNNPDMAKVVGIMVLVMVALGAVALIMAHLDDTKHERRRNKRRKQRRARQMERDRHARRRNARALRSLRTY